MAAEDSIIRIPCASIKSFMYYWILFLKPFHHLTDREMEVIVSFLVHRYELSKVIADNDVLDNVTMSNETKTKVREDCELTFTHFQIILNKLKKRNVIIDNRINPSYIPSLKEEKGKFKMLLLFELQ